MSPKRFSGTGLQKSCRLMKPDDAISQIVTVIFVVAALLFIASFVVPLVSNQLGPGFKFGDLKVVTSNNGADLEVSYSAEKPVSIALVGPDGTVIGSDVVSPAATKETLSLTRGAFKNPLGGNYTLVALSPTDGRRIIEKAVSFSGSSVTIKNFSVSWGPVWDVPLHNKRSMGLRVELGYSGDLPKHVGLIARMDGMGLNPSWEGWVSSNPIAVNLNTTFTAYTLTQPSPRGLSVELLDWGVGTGGTLETRSVTVDIPQFPFASPSPKNCNSLFGAIAGC